MHVFTLFRGTFFFIYELCSYKIKIILIKNADQSTFDY